MCVCFSAFLPGFSLLYAINNNSYTEIRKISLKYFNDKETTLASWRRVGDFAGLDYDYRQDRLYWADSFSIYRSFLNGTGKLHLVLLVLNMQSLTMLDFVTIKGGYWVRERLSQL